MILSEKLKSLNEDELSLLYYIVNYIPENKVKKYFSLIECWAYCDICQDMISLKIDKKEIINGLEMGIYTKQYRQCTVWQVVWSSQGQWLYGLDRTKSV